MGILLFIIAKFTTPFFDLIGIIYGCFRILISRHFKGRRWEVLNEYFETMAISKDQHSNVTMKYLFNDIMVKVPGYQFGDPDKTISYVLGRNKKNNSLRWFGYFWACFLNRIDKNHVENALKPKNKIR